MKGLDTVKNIDKSKNNMLWKKNTDDLKCDFHDEVIDVKVAYLNLNKIIYKIWMKKVVFIH